MRNITFDPSFKRAYKSLLKKRPDLKLKIETIFYILATDAFEPSLQTHKLRGQLSGSWACTVEYDCRIVFDFVQPTKDGEEEILLIDIGSHDEVY